MKIGAIIFARSDSSRFPGKVFSKLGNQMLHQWVIGFANKLEGVTPIFATTNTVVDNELASRLVETQIQVFRGDKHDIAKRVLDCCDLHQLDYFFRINGDSPFLNVGMYHEALSIVKQEKMDLVSNLINRTYPYGCSCELIKVASFRHAYQNFSQGEKEHITSYYYKNLKDFTFGELSKLDEDYSNLIWTVDTQQDLERLNYFLKQSNIGDIHLQSVQSVITGYQNVIKQNK